jgi:hypothetical protein
MGNFYFLMLPVNLHDLFSVEQILRRADIIRIGVGKDDFDQYSTLSYQEQIQHYDTKFYALLDRNLMTDVISIVRGTPIIQGKTGGVNSRILASALMCFLLASDTMLDPTIALYEFTNSTESTDYTQANEELSLFESAHKVAPQIYADLALGRTEELKSEHIPPISDNPIKITKDFYGWRLHYGFILKLALLELSNISAPQKIKNYIFWMWKDYFFGAAATDFAIIYFSNNRIKNMVKNLRSGDKQKVLKGLRNAAWDIAILNYWGKKFLAQKQQNKFWMFCTADKALKQIANRIITNAVGDDKLLNDLKGTFINTLGKQDGEELTSFYIELDHTRDDPNRRFNRLNSIEELNSLVTEMECELLSSLNIR